MALYREKERDYIMIKKDITIYLSILIINLWHGECFTFSNHSSKCLNLLQICPLAKWLFPPLVRLQNKTYYPLNYTLSSFFLSVLSSFLTTSNDL